MKFAKKLIALVLINCSFFSFALAQPSKTFESIIDKIFVNDLFIVSAAPTLGQVTSRKAGEALLDIKSVISTSVASFPLTSTIAGVTIDLQTGVPELITESLGPIFGERAETIGKGKIYFGVNYTNFNLSKFRGLPIEDFQFTITIDNNQNGILGGDDPNDFIDNDTIDFFPDLHLNASTIVLYSTYGVTTNLDVGVAIPFITLSFDGTAKAVINSITLQQLGQAIFNFNDDVLHPELTDTFAYANTVSGIGDIALRVKYSFAQESSLDIAGFLEYRLATGNEDDFLGTGKPSLKLSTFLSKKIGDFNPHLNLGYDYRMADLDSDEFEFTLGFDQKLTNRISFAVDLIGEIDLQSEEAVNIFPGTTIITRTKFQGQASYEETIELSNIPEDTHDNRLNVAFGFKITPSDRILLLGNVLIPMNDGGIRSKVVPTFGISVIF